jgi:hypothetical protein
MGAMCVLVRESRGSSNRAIQFDLGQFVIYAGGVVLSHILLPVFNFALRVVWHWI